MLQIQTSAPLVVALAATMLCGCNSELPPEPQRGNRIVAECPSQASEAYYIPPDAINPEISDTRRKALREQYSHFLRNADASAYWCGIQPRTRAFRLLWVPAGRPAKLFEVVEDSDHWNVRAVLFGDALKGQDTYQVVSQTSTNVS